MILYLIILFEGFVTISLEILTMRQLMPIVGNNVIITSLIIGVFLLFLAYGYRKGGNCESNYTETLRKNFIVAALGCGFGLSYRFIEAFFKTVRIIMPHSTLLPLVLYLLLIIAPIVYALGQTVPITLNLWKKQKTISATGGQILHLSTIGSFLGATLTALLLLDYLGVAWSVVINFSILIVLVVLLGNVKTHKIELLILMILSAFVWWLNVDFEKSFFVATNNYANYRIVTLSNNKEPSKYLIINDSASSYLNSKKQGLPYIELIKKILLNDLNFKNKNILVLGAGGFTLSAEKTQDNHFTYVDIDKQIAPIVRKNFLAEINGNFVADDARHYLNMITTHYDAIVSDVYSNRHSIPAQLLTREYFLSIKNALVDGGIMFVNIIGNPSLSDPYSKHVDNTIRAVFSDCMVIPLHYNFSDGNIIYVCKKSANEDDKTIYTDDLNRAPLEHGMDSAK